MRLSTEETKTTNTYIQEQILTIKNAKFMRVKSEINKTKSIKEDIENLTDRTNSEPG